jgi:hypothetical protein
MSAEQKINTVRPDVCLTVFDVWERILNRHPEIIKQPAVMYSQIPHGQTANEQVEVLPIERIIWDLDSGENGFYGQAGFQKAIGSRVEIGPPDLDPTLCSPEAGYWFNDGEILTIDPRHEKFFIFVDLESKPSNEALGLFKKALKNWGTDWYLLDTGKGFHLIIDRLVSSKDLPKYYGQLIMDVARELGPIKNKLYGHIGKYLIDNHDNNEKLGKWANDILEKFGHIEDSINLGKLVFPIDLRYVAHFIEKIISNQSDLICLRVGEEHGSVPILKALQINNQITIFEYKNDPFNRKQLSLPKL